MVILRANPLSCPRNHVSEHPKSLCFVGQNAHVQDDGFHLATHSLATCALNVSSSSSSSSSQTLNPGNSLEDALENKI